MSEASHQTIRLARGKHAGPAGGACVMELASMLAGEPFSDHPQSVCPVIAAFLREYNDRIDDRRRQDLYEFASLAVGTRGSRAVRAVRARMCVEWMDARRAERRRGLLRLLPRRRAAAVHLDPEAAGRLAGAYAGRIASGRRAGEHEAALDFVERLVAEPREPAANAPRRVPVSA